MIALATFLICFASAAGGTRFLRTYAISRHLVDRPNERSSHVTPTPRLGGLGIAGVSVVASLALLMLRVLDSDLVLGFILGGCVMTVVGFVDDLRTLSPTTKLAGETIAVAAAMALCGALARAAVASQLGIAIALVTYTNFFNFMDGSDGLAAGIAVCSSAGLALVGVRAHVPDVASMAVPIAASAAGFLVYNRPPATIFMGDAGSLFLGFSLAFLGLGLYLRGVTPVAPALILSPFIFDAGYTLLARLSRRERVWKAHRSHLYQRLIRTGVSHGSVAILYWSWNIVVCALALSTLNTSKAAATVSASAGLVPGFALAIYVRHRERINVGANQPEGIPAQ